MSLVLQGGVLGGVLGGRVAPAMAAQLPALLASHRSLLGTLSCESRGGVSDGEGEHYQPDPQVRMKAMQVIREGKEKGLRDYLEQKNAYHRVRYPTPPSDVKKIPMPRFAKRASGGGGGPVGAVKAGGVKLRVPARADSPEGPRESDDYAKEVHFHQRRLNERAMAAKPKNILQKHIAGTEGRILHHKCGGAVERRAPSPPSVACTQKTPEEIIVVSPTLPQYNGTYTLAPGADDGGTRWENGTRWLYRSRNRWRLDDVGYTWIEAAHPHEGKPAFGCVKWDVWDAKLAKWTYDPSIIVSPVYRTRSERGRRTKEVAAMHVQSPEVDMYHGQYTEVEGVVLDGQRVYMKGTLALMSYEGYWIVYDTAYEYAETSVAPDGEEYPGTAAWDRWDGRERAWVGCTVNLIYPTREDDCIHSEVTTATGMNRTVGTMPGTAGTGTISGSVVSSGKPSVVPPTANSATFLTQLGRAAEEAQDAKFRRDSETEETLSLVEHLPPLQLPNFTCEDVVSGKVLSGKREITEVPLSHNVDPDDVDSEERIDHRKQQAKKIESILFGLQKGNVKLSEAQRVFGLTYRFNDVASSLTPMPNHFAKFADCYGTEKAAFYLRCTREIRRVATQRPLLFKKKHRILGEILKNQPEMKATNPRWRHASRSLHKKIFADVEKDFRVKRDGLLRIWLERCMEALPELQPPACRAVCVYLEELIEDPDLVLSKENFLRMCDSVLATRHFLLKDVICLLWCIKWLFQVTDEQFVEIVRYKTRTLFEYQLALPPLPGRTQAVHPPTCLCASCLNQPFRDAELDPAVPDASDGSQRAPLFTPKPPTEPHLPPLAPPSVLSSPAHSAEHTKRVSRVL